MSHSRSGELSAAVHQHLMQCTPVEGLGALAAFAGVLLSIAPGPQREIARGLFIEMIDREVARRAASGPTGGMARE